MLPRSARNRPIVDVTHVPVPILVLHGDADAVEANEAWTEMTHQSAAAASGRGWLEAVHPADRERVLAALRRWADGTDEDERECEWRLEVDGTRTASMRPAPGPDHVLVVAFVETTGWRARERELFRQATHDPLTGTFNRAVLFDRCERVLESTCRSHCPPAVLFLDLDDFKAINDEHGHPAGDAVLRALALRMEGAARPGDTFARVGGDEFVLLCEGLTDHRDAERIAERIRAAAREPLELGGDVVVVDVSVGVALGERGDTVDSLLERADRDLYARKRRRGAA